MKRFYSNLSKLSVMLVLLAATISSCEHKSIEQKVDSLLSEMTLQEKIDQLGGIGFETKTNKRLNIPLIKMTDGPAGVRWGKATAFPAPIALAASWDRDLLNRVGKAIAEEVKAKGRSSILGPCVNIQRIPVGGRNFESYGEDPYLTSQMAVSYIKGVQSQNVIACVKHYVCNNQEWERGRLDVLIGERPLREIYLPAFKAAVHEADVWSIMAAYNLVNGKYCTENSHLLTDILKNEWGFKGYVVSDWGATHSTAEAANAGLDLEMPFGRYFGSKLLEVVKDGKVSEEIINDKVRRLLRVRFKAGMFNERTKPDTTILKSAAHKQLALEAAEKGIVLLKNKNDLLPLKEDRIKTIAVIGPDADSPITGGGGSARVTPYYTISPLKGMKDRAGENIKIYYAPGVPIKGDILPLESEYIIPPSGSGDEHGLWGEYFSSRDLEGKPVISRLDSQINFNWGYNMPDPALEENNDMNQFSIRWTGKILPKKTGLYKFNTLNNDGVRLYLNNKLILDEWEENSIKKRSVPVYLTAGRTYDIKIEYFSEGGISVIKFGWEVPGEDTIDKAISIAKKADVAVVFAGLSNRFESESYDRASMELPNQDKLIRAVADANSNTIVVMCTGSPVLMTKWADKVPAILQAWYAGQEAGNGIVAVLFGDYNPSGKLPCSFIRRQADSPAFNGYKDKSLKAPYTEGIFVGYRYLDKNQIEPLFPFGHGLSYTEFKYSNLRIEKTDSKEFNVYVDITNTEKVEGAETVELYVRDVKCSVERPEKELKGFSKVVLKPGEKKTVTIHLKKDAFAFYSEDKNQWVVEPGEFDILVGSSSRDIRVRGSLKIL